VAFPSGQIVELLNPVETTAGRCVRIGEGLKTVVAARWSRSGRPMTRQDGIGGFEQVAEKVNASPR
jgi:hypothetical protein